MHNEARLYSWALARQPLERLSVALPHHTKRRWQRACRGTFCCLSKQGIGTWAPETAVNPGRPDLVPSAMLYRTDPGVGPSRTELCRKMADKYELQTFAAAAPDGRPANPPGPALPYSTLRASGRAQTSLVALIALLAVAALLLAIPRVILPWAQSSASPHFDPRCGPTMPAHTTSPPPWWRSARSSSICSGADSASAQRARARAHSATRPGPR